MRNILEGLIQLCLRFSCHHLLRGWEKLLHQAFLVGLEGFVLLGFGGDQGVEAAQARGDALLFGRFREEDHKGSKPGPRNLRLSRTADDCLQTVILEVVEDKILPQLPRPWLHDHRVACDP